MAVQTYTTKKFLDNYERQAARHIKTFMPTLRQAFGPLHDQKILDIGCGDGRITAELARAGASVVGIDRSTKWIQECRKKYKRPTLRFQTLNAVDVAQLLPESYDGVLMNMVFINIDTIQEISKVIRGIGRVLKPGGVFIFSDLHPALIMQPHLPDRRFTFASGFSYYKDGGQFTAHVRIDAQTEISFTNRHWTPALYSKLLSQHGFSISRIFELQRDQQLPYAKQYKVPEFIVFSCRKQPAVSAN